jgi:O-Antigen ligase
MTDVAGSRRWRRRQIDNVGPARGEPADGKQEIMAQFEPADLIRPEVRIAGARLAWPGRAIPVPTDRSEAPTPGERVRNTITLITVFLYLLFNWGFQQVRIPPVVGGGIPVGEIVLLIALLTIRPGAVLGRLSHQVYLLPFVLWWVFGIGRALVDVSHHGFWALRDAAHVLESLFFVVGFVFAAYPSTIERFFSWLPKFLVIAVAYGLLYPVSDIFWSISPTITSGNGYVVPIIGTMANSAFLMIMAAFYLLLFHSNSLLALFAATLLIGYPLAVFQTRTLYLVTIALFGFLAVTRRSNLGHLLLIVVVAGLLLAIVTLVGLRVEGRLGELLSVDFLVDHFLAIFGVCVGEHDAVCAAAAGVDQRLGWWQNIFDQMLADPFKLLLGLGYGVTLTDFYATGGTAVREPHNSYITILARTGMVGAVCWFLMMISLVHRWHLSFRLCRDLAWREGQNRLLLLMVFFICMWVLAIGEDAFEKPYNTIPFYFFWGIVIRFGLLLANGQVGPEAEGFSDRQPDHPSRARLVALPGRAGQEARADHARGPA